MDDRSELVGMAAEIVSAYVTANPTQPKDIPALIRSVYIALCDLSGEVRVAAEPAPEPAVPIKKSVTPDFIICLEDGKKFKSLKRHLRTRYGMSPDEYRAKWSLGADYPMVAPNYAKARSDLAKRMGLGQGGAGAKTRREE